MYYLKIISAIKRPARSRKPIKSDFLLDEMARHCLRMFNFRNGYGLEKGTISRIESFKGKGYIYRLESMGRSRNVSIRMITSANPSGSKSICFEVIYEKVYVFKLAPSFGMTPADLIEHERDIKKAIDQGIEAIVPKSTVLPKLLGLDISTELSTTDKKARLSFENHNLTFTYQDSKFRGTEEIIEKEIRENEEQLTTFKLLLQSLKDEKVKKAKQIQQDQRYSKLFNIKIQGTNYHLMISEMIENPFLFDVLKEMQTLDVVSSIYSLFEADSTSNIGQMEGRYKDCLGDNCDIYDIQPSFQAMYSELGKLIDTRLAKFKNNLNLKNKLIFYLMLSQLYGRDNSKVKDFFARELSSNLKEADLEVAYQIADLKLKDTKKIDAYFNLSIQEIRRKHFEKNKAKRKQIAEKLLDLLYKLNTNGIAIRDLKPENIFIADTSDYTLGLIDLETAFDLETIASRDQMTAEQIASFINSLWPGTSINLAQVDDILETENRHREPLLAATLPYASATQIIDMDNLAKIFGKDFLSEIYLMQDFFAVFAILYSVFTGSSLFSSYAREVRTKKNIILGALMNLQTQLRNKKLKDRKSVV